MNQLTAVLILCTLPHASMAQDAPKDDAPLTEEFNKLADGMRKLLESFSDDVAPMMEGLAEQLKGLDAYHPPEVLPNGDIIIRRKTPSEQDDRDKDTDEDVIDI